MKFGIISMNLGKHLASDDMKEKNDCHDRMTHR